jgi:hypothetical protein
MLSKIRPRDLFQFLISSEIVNLLDVCYKSLGRGTFPSLCQHLFQTAQNETGERFEMLTQYSRAETPSGLTEPHRQNPVPHICRYECVCIAASVGVVHLETILLFPPLRIIYHLYTCD